MRCRKDGPCSTRMKGSMYPRSARLRLVKLRFTRLRSANPFFRDLLMTLARRCRYPLPLAFRAENAALALRTPPPHGHAAGHRRSIRADACASGSQGYYQHHAIIEPENILQKHVNQLSIKLPLTCTALHSRGMKMPQCKTSDSAPSVKPPCAPDGANSAVPRAGIQFTAIRTTAGEQANPP